MVCVNPQGGSFDQDLINAFFPDGSNPAFSICDCIWRSKRGVDDMKAFGLENSIKRFAEFTIVVVDQET